MTTVCVTGACGFIGRWVVADLLERGYDVVGIDNCSHGNRRNVAAFAEDDSWTFLKRDIRERAEVTEVIGDETDKVIHLAAEIDVHESLEEPESHFDTNVVGTQNVLEACRATETGVSIVGTCMVYDVAATDTGIAEDHPVKPASPYAGSKLAAENLAESYYHGYDLDVRLLRPFNTYGPFQEDGVVPIFVDRDIRGETLKIFGDGTQTRDLLYATDCARFIVEATFSDEAAGEVINAGTGTDVTISELADLVASDGTAIEHVKHHHPQSEIDELRCDPSKAEELLGWTPEVTLEEGIQSVREWLNRRGN